MINPPAAEAFFKTHRAKFDAIEKIRATLNARFHGADDAVNAILLAALTDVPCLLFGPPGVAKSKLIRDFCGIVGVDTAGDTGDGVERVYFEYLLTPFTEPTELFGSFELRQEDGGGQKLVRIETGMLHKCRIAFLDEVFNGSSGILNSLLAILNEGRFHDKGEVKRSALQLIFGATNDLPTTAALRAIFDRFVIRTRMENVDRLPEEFLAYLGKATAAQRPLISDERFPALLDDLKALHEDFETRQQSAAASERLFDFETKRAAAFLENLTYLTDLSGSLRLGTFSNRRVYQLMRALLMQRMMRAAREGFVLAEELTLDDYAIVWKHFLDIDRPLRQEEIAAFEKLNHLSTNMQRVDAD